MRLSRRLSFCSLIAFAVVGFVAYGQPMTASASASADRLHKPIPRHELAELKVHQLQAEWSAAHFVAPTKPAQGIVNSAYGRAVTGADYGNVVRLIRLATLDLQVGRDEEALGCVAQAHKIIDK